MHRNEANPNCPDDWGRTPLLIATARENVAVVMLLLGEETSIRAFKALPGLCKANIGGAWVVSDRVSNDKFRLYKYSQNRLVVLLLWDFLRSNAMSCAIAKTDPMR